MIGPGAPARAGSSSGAGPLRRLLVLLPAALAVPVLPAVPDAGAETAPARLHRAALIVDTGEQVKKVCVRFSEPSISGTELLERAQVEAVLRPYAGKGVAVCSLCGTGCRADDSCLTCDPEGRYWAYSRAAAGTSRFELSPAGASGTRVHDGDVEGWRWSHGASPAFVGVAEVCDGVAPAGSTDAVTTSTSVAAGPVTTGPAGPATSSTPGGPVTSAPSAGRSPATTRATGGSSSGAGGSAGPGRATAPPSVGATGSAVPTGIASAGSPGTAAHRGSDGAAAGGGAGAGTRASDRGSGSPGGLLIAAGLVAALVAWSTRARRRRAGPPRESP